MRPCGLEFLRLSPAPKEIALRPRSRSDIGRSSGVWICQDDIDLIVKEIEHLPFVELCVGALGSYEAQASVGERRDRDRKWDRAPGVEVAFA